SRLRVAVKLLRWPRGEASRLLVASPEPGVGLAEAESGTLRTAGSGLPVGPRSLDKEVSRPSEQPGSHGRMTFHCEPQEDGTIPQVAVGEPSGVPVTLSPPLPVLRAPALFPHSCALFRWCLLQGHSRCLVGCDRSTPCSDVLRALVVVLLGQHSAGSL
ncbi:hypothetical protein H1C71_000189, partial [Ictidomys tridecemlineatus]